MHEDVKISGQEGRFCGEWMKNKDGKFVPFGRGML